LDVQQHGVARLSLTAMMRLKGDARQGDDSDSSICHVLLSGTATMVTSFLGMDLDCGLVRQLKCQRILVLRLAQPNEV
jgi:hypothetical protein